MKDVERIVFVFLILQGVRRALGDRGGERVGGGERWESG